MADSNDPLEQLKRSIKEQKLLQERAKADIKQSQDDIRALRAEKSKLASQRAELEKLIRDLKTEMLNEKNIIRDKSLPEGMRSEARDRLSDLENQLYYERKEIAELGKQSANKNISIQERLAGREESEYRLSSSRRDAREYSSRRSAIESAGRITPRSYEQDLRRELAPDPELEGLRAGKSLAKSGGTAQEQQQIQQLASEFSQLFPSIRETKKALAALTVGTEEHTKKEQELTDLQQKAADTIGRIDKIERDVEKRKLLGGSDQSTGQRIASFGLSAMGGMARFGGDAFERLGAQATERYALEEEKKQAQLRLQHQAMQDARNRTDDATAFLATGGGGMFGAEMPWDRRGGVNAAANALGQDYSNTRRAIPQYALAYRALGGLADVGQNVLAKGVEGAGITGVSGLTYAGGEAIRGMGGLMMNTAREGMLTPEVGGKLGGKEVADAMRDVLSGGVGAMSSAGQFGLGGMLEWGGGDRSKGEQGVRNIAQGSEKVLTALPNVLTRAYKAVDQMNELVKTEQSAAQAARIRERLGMAFAPAMQQYMDAQDASAPAMRSRNMSRRQREDYERQLEMFSLDEQLSERGFGVNEIMANTAQAAQGLGRFGAGGVSERVAKSGMLAESMGLGGAAQNIQSMVKMKAGGVDDPETLFTKAVKEGLQRGLQDSRQFQELLDAAQSTSDGVGDFEGAIRGIMTFAGSGRANDVTTAAAAARTAEERMSGKTGTWRDMVKFDVTNKAAQSAISAARNKGISLTREDQTSLQNLTNMDVKQLENPEMLNSILTSGARKAIEASGKTVDQYGKDLARNLRVQGTLADSINATQSPELAALRKDLAEGNYTAIQQKYKNNPERLKDLVALAGSGASASGGPKEIAGAQQMVINGLKQAGFDVSGMGMQRSYESIDADTALAESGAAMTGLDQRRKGRARVSQADQAMAMSVNRNAKGESEFARLMSQTEGNYADQQSRMAKNVISAKTVSPEREVAPIDDAVKQMVEGLKEIKDAFKDFSAKDFVVNATQDIVIQGAKSIKGVILDNGLTQAATEAGKTIADTVKGAFTSSDKTAPAPRAPSTNKSVPVP